MSSALATKYFPQSILDVAAAVGDKELFTVKRSPNRPDAYELNISDWVPRSLYAMCPMPNDWWNIRAISKWLAHGPKAAKPTLEMCEAMKNIEVRLKLEDLSVPFPEIMVEVQGVEPYWCCLVAREESGATSISLMSRDHQHDITSLLATRPDIPEWVIEDTLHKYDDSCKGDDTKTATMALRIAINSCLLLTDKTKWADWHLAQSDQRLAKERTERGERARKRLSLHVLIAQFDQEIEWRRDCEKHHWEAGEPTGRVMPPHWRKGHWRMQPYGPKNELRKRILVPPTRVNWHLFTGQEKETGVKYV